MYDELIYDYRYLRKVVHLGRKLQVLLNTCESILINWEKFFHEFFTIHTNQHPNQQFFDLDNFLIHLQLQGWRANIDLKLILSIYATLQYIAKYASKAEPRSATFSEILKFRKFRLEIM